MGQILGIGTTHYPGAVGPAGNMSGIVRSVLADPGLPEKYRDPANWPAQMREEYGNDQGAEAGRQHQAALKSHFKRAREELDRFNPDVVIIFGDDQYENFKEDIIPPFCVQAYEELVFHPFAHARGPNVWGEGPDTEFRIKGHREAGKYLTRRMIEQDIDTPYAYEPLHGDLSHAFANTILFLDWERKGWPWPVIPFQINCYGSRVIYQRGGRGPLGKQVNEGDLDPPSPSPKRCMQVGAAIARAMSESPWKTALIASSSWSHAFLTDKNWQLHPDVPADRRLFDALTMGDYDTWRKTPLSSFVESGQQEMLNWAALAGAMDELGRKPDVCEFVETWVCNSDKILAIFRP
ncbi:MAG: extradiol ring-cleavage dioxygenase [Chloroflexi bacterium]|nr:extradiol ring-cleavage dioxygenase [Chloroflexota bacterium]